MTEEADPHAMFTVCMQTPLDIQGESPPPHFSKKQLELLGFPICAFAWTLFWGCVDYLVKLLNRVYSKQNLFGSVFVPLHRCIFAALRSNCRFTICAQRVTLLEHICWKQVQPLYVTLPTHQVFCVLLYLVVLCISAVRKEPALLHCSNVILGSFLSLFRFKSCFDCLETRNNGRVSKYNELPN